MGSRLKPGFAAIASAAAVAVLVWSTIAAGDVYRCSAEPGENRFTDSPVTDDAVLILREEGPDRGNAKPEAPPRRSPAVGRSARASGARAPVEGTITSGLGLRSHPTDGSLRNHVGVDIAVPEGTEVRAIAPGRVTYSGFRGGYGNLVVVDHENGLVSLYAHNLLNLAVESQRVEARGVIAISGSTGRSTGPHLHFEVWRDGANVTEAYLENRFEPRTGAAARAGVPGEDLIRKIILADGSLLFTNLPVDSSP